MKRDYNKLHLGSITVRMPESMLEKLDDMCGAGQKYRDRSEVIRSLITLGMQIESLLEIHSDPKKKKEFEEKLIFLFQENNLEKTMETMTEKELSTIIFIATNLQDKKIQQLVFDVKKS